VFEVSFNVGCPFWDMTKAIPRYVLDTIER
jgi:hypothetical protein